MQLDMLGLVAHDELLQLGRMISRQDGENDLRARLGAKTEFPRAVSLDWRNDIAGDAIAAHADGGFGQWLAIGAKDDAVDGLSLDQRDFRRPIAQRCDRPKLRHTEKALRDIVIV